MLPIRGQKIKTDEHKLGVYYDFLPIFPSLSNSFNAVKTSVTQNTKTIQTVSSVVAERYSEKKVHISKKLFYTRPIQAMCC